MDTESSQEVSRLEIVRDTHKNVIDTVSSYRKSLLTIAQITILIISVFGGIYLTVLERSSRGLSLFDTIPFFVLFITFVYTMMKYAALNIVWGPNSDAIRLVNDDEISENREILIQNYSDCISENMQVLDDLTNTIMFVMGMVAAGIGAFFGLLLV